MEQTAASTSEGDGETTEDDAWGRDGPLAVTTANYARGRGGTPNPLAVTTANYARGRGGTPNPLAVTTTEDDARGSDGATTPVAPDDAWTRALDGAKTPTPATDLAPASDTFPAHDGDAVLRFRGGPILDFMDERRSRDAAAALSTASFIDPGRIGEAASAYELSALDADHDDGSTSSPFAVEHTDGEGEPCCSEPQGRGTRADDNREWA